MIDVAILGFGTVGSGVADVLTENVKKIKRSSTVELNVKYIVDIRDFPESVYADKMVKDFRVVESDPDVKVVVETIGGTGVAFDFTKRALSAGKSVVTSNKELVATHGYELLTLAKKNNVNYLFEASVGGGIPILRPISQCLAGNDISEVFGILNGTTNYVLTQMIENNVEFDDALRQAQKLGYAEADPTADIEGLDACRKICILATLCFGKHIYPQYVPAEGITRVTLDDVAFADKIGYKIKLLGRAVKGKDDKIIPYVAAHLLPKKRLLANVSDVMNGIVVKGNAVGEVMFYGPGAGKLPTASAVAADVIDAAKHIGMSKLLFWEDGDAETVGSTDELVSQWYVRAKCQSDEAAASLGTISVVGSVGDELVFTTEPVSGAQFREKAEALQVQAAFRIMV
ncbi:MAG: homoserine dehydrogenase [Oscillospiraceae bacterium]|nr:homoserine dehydrogenase [Oscillospiraceae bacterium]